MSMDKFASATIEDIMRDPKKFGAPTFEEFSRNPAAYRARTQNIFDAADNGSQILKMVKRHRYEINGYKCDSLEEVERVALSEGLRPEDLEMKPEIIDLGGQWCDILVRFRSVKKEPEL